MNQTYSLPIELRITNKTTHYRITKVFSGIGNVAFVQRPFVTRKDAIDWCKQEYPNVPRIMD